MSKKSQEKDRLRKMEEAGAQPVTSPGGLTMPAATHFNYHRAISRTIEEKLEKQTSQ